MIPNPDYSKRLLTFGFLSSLILFLSLTGCKPDGFINKVNYKGEKYINTCTSFTEEVGKLVADNSEPTKLTVSQYDNSDFKYYYLEPGQFEIIDDTLKFRLASDLNYPKYLDKGVAVHVFASFAANEKVAELESNPSGEIGKMVVSREYYVANRRPFFIYKFPLDGAEVEGKQIKLAFSIVKYDSKGKIKKVFCNSETEPIGIAMPACCTSIPWENTSLQSVIDFPKLEVNDESFSYEGFTGTIDVSFDENSYSFPDTLLGDLIQAYINKFKEFDFKPAKVDIKGYASPGGKESLNQTLSENRAKIVEEGVHKYNNGGLVLESAGMGEDWTRVKELTQKSSLTPDQKDMVLAIANEQITNDEKEAKLRLVPFWETLVEEVLVKARHTFVVMDFKYIGNNVTLERYGQRLPISSSELEKVAGTVFNVSGYADGKDVQEEMKTINDILRKKANPNLYVMRSTYYLAQNDVNKAIADLEKAAQLDPSNAKYAQAVKGFKIAYSDTYSFDQKKKMYQDYNTLASQNPGDRELFFNRAILMDKIGFISGALSEYDKLLEGNTPSAANYNNRGVARLRTNMLTLAQSDFSAALSLNKELAEAYFNLAVIAAYQGLTDKSAEYLDQAIAIDEKYKGMILNNPAFSVVSEDPRFDKYRN
jgi:tetratricopeptide (TPR) repeat protein/outer membrane protein OmpA-like peptidoglycan-associated protein